MSLAIPLAKVAHQYAGLEEEHLTAIREVLADGRFILGPWVVTLEERIARLSGAAHGVAVASGTDAIHFALRALGISEGGEVIVPAFTFFASASAVAHAGGRPVFVDVDPETWLIDPESVRSRITPRTRAMIAVHLYGHPAPMTELRAIADRHGLAIVEDASQAIGSSLGGRPVGSFGDAATYSFYPTKNLGGTGDGGMVVTGRLPVADGVRRLRGHGTSNDNEHGEMGYNSRLDSIDAATLLVRLPHLSRWNEARRANAAFYTKELAVAASGITPPRERAGAHHVYHLYVIHVAKGRDDLRKTLLDAGIGSGVYYPTPLHLVGAFRDLGYRKGELPVSEDAASSTLAIPVHPGLTEGERSKVLSTILSWAKKETA